MKKQLIGLLVLTLAALLGLVAQPAVADDSKTITFTVDVAEDGTQFVFNPVHDTDSMPLRGATFVTHGHLFPKGTIQGDGSDFDPNSSGSVGNWTCTGSYLVNGDQIPAAAIWVETTQIYDLLNKKASLATQGFEGVDPTWRVVSGGTGALAGWIGTQKQVFLGFNKSMGVNLRVTFILTKK